MYLLVQTQRTEFSHGSGPYVLEAKYRSLNQKKRTKYRRKEGWLDIQKARWEQKIARN